MGLLVDGVWHDKWYQGDKGGRFVRPDSVFRSWVTPDGAPGPSGGGGFPAEAGRYHLYIARSCPWAHRTLVVRALKGLQDIISVSYVGASMLSEGWTFSDGDHRDDVNGKERLYEVYLLAKADYSGRVTVPVLWDKERRTIVNNESSEIIRMLNSAFDGLGANASLDLYPAELRGEIDAINAAVYPAINNGVYRAGFATSQSAYEEAFTALFAELDRLEALLSRQRWLVGNRFTEADVRLFTTLVRFDLVYHGHFKCNRSRIADMPILSGYLRDLYQTPGVAETVDPREIKHHYYFSQRAVNPTGIVPLGPPFDLSAPAGRDHLGPPALG